MKRRARAGGLLLAMLLAPGLGGAVAPAAPNCHIPQDLAEVDATLQALRAKLRAKAPVRIVAIGGGSTAGAAAGSPDLSWPHWLALRLAQLFPSAPVTVVNKGVPRQSAAQMVARFPADVFAERPALVIWEAGINDAVHGVDIDDFAGAMQRGVDQLKARGIDVILLDIQFSRTTESLIDFARYLDALHRIGEVNGLYVFPRYAIMRYWSEENMFDFDTVEKDARAKLAASVYRCIGERLAEAVRAAAR
jgi:acyl-CoA thioesterase-1